MAWMLRTLIFNPVAILLVLAAWWWRSRLPVAWSVVRWFYGVMWTLFGLFFLQATFSLRHPAGLLSGIAVVAAVALLASLWREWTNRRRTAGCTGRLRGGAFEWYVC